MSSSVLSKTLLSFNPLVTYRLSHPYHLDESIFILKGVRSKISFLFHISMKIISANMSPRFAASHLGPLCLPMSHKKDARLIWVNRWIIFILVT